MVTCRFLLDAAISGKIDKIEDTKANAAACGDDFVCKGAIYGKPITDTAGAVGGVKTLGTVGRNFCKSVDNFAEGVGKSTATEAQKARQIDINAGLDGEMVYSRGVNFSTENIPTNIHQGKQDKHYFGSNNYTENRSYIHSNINAQELLDGVHTGQYPVVSVGNRNMPVVDFGKEIGIVKPSGNPTNYGTIHYGKNDAHIVPTEPKTIPTIHNKK
ncbi:MAG: hypothetical protein IJ566_02355 [Cardiobacteriaceae bacterium]|nr:hypothetical protein [Cardiobacteriaceae bacterium]